MDKEIFKMRVVELAEDRLAVTTLTHELKVANGYLGRQRDSHQIEFFTLETLQERITNELAELNKQGEKPTPRIEKSDKHYAYDLFFASPYTGNDSISVEAIKSIETIIEHSIPIYEPKVYKGEWKLLTGLAAYGTMDDEIFRAKIEGYNKAMSEIGVKVWEYTIEVQG